MLCFNEFKEICSMAGFIRYRDVFTFRNLEAFDNWIVARNETWRIAIDSSQQLNSIYYKCVLIVFGQFFNI